MAEYISEIVGGDMTNTRRLPFIDPLRGSADSQQNRRATFVATPQHYHDCV